MEELLKQLWTDLIGRVHGPFAFRLFLQPLSAAIIACRAGLRDARSGRPAYGWAVLSNPGEPRELLTEGCRELSKVFIVAGILDVLYAIIVFHEIYPRQSLIRGALLALFSYPFFPALLTPTF